MCLGFAPSVFAVPLVFPGCAVLGPARALFLFLGCLEFVVAARALSSFASVVSSLAAASVARPAAPAVPAWVARVPRASLSAPVSLSGAVVFVRGDSVCVSVGGVVRECRVSYLPRAGLPALSVEAVFRAVSARVAAGASVRFVAAFGYSPDRWFCGSFPV